MNTSETINELAAALAKARLKIENPTFDKKNPHFNAMYATLAGCLNAVTPSLSENGLALVQEPVVEEGGAGVEWMLTHASGQWMRGRVVLPLEKKTAQGVGSALTYAKRYTLVSVLGIAGEEDDDGNGAEPPPPKTQTRKPAEPKTNGTERPEYLKPLDKLLKEAGAKNADDCEDIVSRVTGKTTTWAAVKADATLAAALVTPLSDAVKEHGSELAKIAKSSF